jgi:predicted RNA methylase
MRASDELRADAIIRDALLGDLKRENGFVITPRDIANAVVKHIPLHETVLDPCCGTGTVILARIAQLMGAGYPVEHIEKSVRGYDIEAGAVKYSISNLKTEYPQINGKVIFMQKDIFELEGKHFNTSITNPPWCLKNQDGSMKIQTWVRFANKALELADTVIVIGPKGTRTKEHPVILDDIRFEGVDCTAQAIIWSELVTRDLSHLPKFDIRFDDVRSCSKNTKGAPVKSWSGTDTFCSRKLYDTVSAAEYWASFLFKANGEHKIRSGLDIVGDCHVVYGKQVEVERFIEFIRSDTGLATVKDLTGGNNKGFLNINNATLREAFCK